MEKLNYIKSSVVPVLIDNIDTDQIIPAEFLKSTSREGFGKNLFSNWRYDEHGNDVEDFPLNNPKWSGTILLGGENFGCGSSREHAVWAIRQYGFQIVLSTSFADIFYGNALNNGLLPVIISEEFYEVLTEELEIDPETKVEINLEKQEVVMVISGQRERFEIPAYKKECLLNGQDDLDFLIGLREELETTSMIESYEV